MLNHAPLLALLASLVIFVIAMIAKVIKLSREQNEGEVNSWKIPRSAKISFVILIIALATWVIAPKQSWIEITKPHAKSQTTSQSGRPRGETLEKDSVVAYPDDWSEAYTLKKQHKSYRLNYPKGGRVKIKASNGREQDGSNSDSEVDLGSTSWLIFRSLTDKPVLVEIEYCD